MPDTVVSLCMIVKDEEQPIERCLNSVKDIVDEMIIVDTGSTDATVDICKKFTDKIFSMTWNDHFAEARNYSISLAKGKWILYLDADEEIDVGDIKNVKEDLQSREEKVLYIPVLNYVGEKKDEREMYRAYQPRLFRNEKKFLFKGRIHETLEFSKDTSTSKFPLTLHHYGYLQQWAEGKNKHLRNVKLLQMEYNDGNEDPWIVYHMASEYYRMRDYETAFELVNVSIVQFIQEESLPPAVVYRLKYAIIFESGHYKGGWPSIEKAIKLYPDYVDLYLMKAHFLFELGHYKEAIETCDHCMTLREDDERYLTLNGASRFHSQGLKKKCTQALRKD